MDFKSRYLLRIFCAALFLSAFNLHADTAAAQKFYSAGKQKVAAKDYAGAVADYTLSLAAEPSYIFARRERATAYYLLGNRSASAADYKAYLEENPKDAQTAEFYARLTGQPATALARAPARPKWGLRLAGGFNTYSFAAWNALLTGSSNGSSNISVAGGTISNGPDFGGELDYRLLPNVLVGFDLDYLMAGSTLSWNSGSGASHFTVKSAFSFPAIWLGPSAYFVMPEIFPSMDLRLGGGLGYFTLSGAKANISAQSSAGGSASSSSNYSGSGFGLKAAVGLDWYFRPQWSAYMDLGWRLASIGPINENPVYISQASNGNGTLQNMDGSTMFFDYSGLLFKVGVGYWF